MSIPKYESRAGIFFPVEEIVKDNKLQRIDNTTIEECIEYTKILEENDYILCETNEISAGKNKSYNKNLFYKYKRDDFILFIFWMASCHRLYISSTENDTQPSERLALNEPQTITPTLAQCKLSSGYVYVIQLCDGSFILIDGDKKDENDTKVLYEYLKEKGSDKEKVKISMWLFSHPDIDHIGLATSFVEEYSEKVEINEFAYQFTDCDKMQYIYIPPSEIEKNINELENNIRKYSPESSVYTLHTGQRFYFSGAQIEILFTADMLYPYFYASANDTSAVLRVVFESGKIALFLGDCMQDSCRQIAYIYGDYLKSDILQVSHHGGIGGEIELYKLIDPEICLWSTSEKRFIGGLEKERFQWCLGEGGCDYNKWIRDESICKRKHYHLGETTVIDC